MKRPILICGLTGGVLITVLRWTEYRFLVLQHSFEIYAALVAAVFAALGIALGSRLTRPRPAIDSTEVPVSPNSLADSLASPLPAPFLFNEQKRASLGLTRRELEILELIAQGLSNREIADKLYVSENTVKTHCSRAFDKLGARRRTQAVQLGKELGLLP
jgi:NarL family two-component system response regulator LiaR